MTKRDMPDRFIIKMIINTYKTREANKVGSFDDCEAFDCSICKNICGCDDCRGGRILSIKALGYLTGGR